MTLEEFVLKVLKVPFVDHGRDWSGLDCWGMIRLAYQEIYGIELISYGERYESSLDLETLQEMIAEEKEELWHEVEDPQIGDLVLLKILGRPIHIGIMVTPRSALHTEDKIGPVIENLHGLAWKNRVEGYYRYATFV